MSIAIKQLSNLCKVITKGTTPTSIGYNFSDNGIIFLRVQNINGGQVNYEQQTLFIDELTHKALSRSQILAGDILVSIAGTIGRAGIVPENAPPLNCNQAVAIVRTNGSIFRPYLRHWLESNDAQSQMIGSTVTGTIANLSLTQIGNLRVPLPPIAEQKRIAEILDRTQSLISKRKEAIAKLETLTQSIFIEIFGDPVANSKGWIKLPFGEVCATRLGKMLDKNKQTGEHRRLYLRNANVQWFRFDLNDVFEMNFNDSELNILRLKYGDLLICEGGESGRTAIWRDEFTECYYQKTLHRARPKSDLANPEYLARLFWFLAHYGGLSDHITSATIAHLTGEKLKLILIPVPPLPLQKEFAQRVEAVEKLKATHRASLSELQALFASLQHRAFRGEL